MKSYTVSYFGLLAERRGISEEQVTSTAGTPSELYQELDATHQLGLTVGNFRAAVNDEFAAWNHPLETGDRIALLPPMSGG
ncbi:MAG: MoaD/ThiS family protein [Luteolibacter sp.]